MECQIVTFDLSDFVVSELLWYWFLCCLYFLCTLFSIKKILRFLVFPSFAREGEGWVMYCYLQLCLLFIFRAWESLSAVTCCRSLVVVYDCRCMLQIGVAAESINKEALAVDVAKLMEGSLYRAVIKSGSRK